MAREGRAARPGDGSKPAELLYTLRNLNGMIHTVKAAGQDTAALKATAVAMCDQLKADIQAV
jgi:hypothetical protein